MSQERLWISTLRAPNTEGVPQAHTLSQRKTSELQYGKQKGEGQNSMQQELIRKPLHLGKRRHCPEWQCSLKIDHVNGPDPQAHSTWGSDHRCSTLNSVLQKKCGCVCACACVCVCKMQAKTNVTGLVKVHVRR